MTQHLIPHRSSPFDSIKQVEQGREYWSARDLQTIMDYNHWREFEGVIERAMIACQNVGQPATDHFGESPKMVPLGSGSQRSVKDYHLSRYACYLVAMNGDPHKTAVAQAQAYFSLKTREAELAQEASRPNIHKLSDAMKPRALENLGQERIKYLHLCPNGRAVWAWAYPNTYLTSFTKWLWGDYFPTHFPTYQYHCAQFLARHRTLPARQRKKSLR